MASRENNLARRNCLSSAATRVSMSELGVYIAYSSYTWAHLGTNL
jgi:hypothetical protein